MEKTIDYIKIEKTDKIRKRTVKTITYIFLVFWALLVLFPFYWMILTSVKSYSAYNSEYIPRLFTLVPTLQNYSEAFTAVSLGRYFANTAVFTVITTVLMLIVITLAAFAFARLEFKGKNALLTLVISLMVFPAEAIMLPMYREMADLGWINTWLALIVPFIAKCFSIYMFRQFFLDIPNDLLEAAKIDGCGPIKTFFKIVMPISGTVYATILILDFVAHWNDFMWPLLVVTGEEKRTIQLAIQTFFGSKPINYGPIMASLTISAIPMLVMFIFLQKYYVEGIASTGIKG